METYYQTFSLGMLNFTISRHDRWSVMYVRWQFYWQLQLRVKISLENYGVLLEGGGRNRTEVLHQIKS